MSAPGGMPLWAAVKVLNRRLSRHPDGRWKRGAMSDAARLRVFEDARAGDPEAVARVRAWLAVSARDSIASPYLSEAERAEALGRLADYERFGEA